MHEQSGAYEHDPQRQAERELEPVPDGPLGDPPACFMGTGESDAIMRPLFVAAWHELAEQVPDGVLTIADRVLVELYCRLLARLRAGETLKAAEQAQILRCLSLMGMTPADRSKVKVPESEKDKRDPFKRLAAVSRIPKKPDAE